MPTKLALNPTTGKLDLIQNLSAYAKLAISITTADLETAIANSTLIPNQWYLITDYQTKDFIRQTSSPVEFYTAPVEQIYLRADTVNTINPEGWSKTYPGEKIYYQQSRDDYSDSAEIAYYGSSSGNVTVSITDANTMSLDVNPFPNPYTNTTFYLDVSDYDTGAYHQFTEADKGVNWEWSGSNFVLLNNTYSKQTSFYIEYDGSTNYREQEVEYYDSLILQATTPLSTMTDWQYDDQGSYWQVQDIDTGAYGYYDFVNKDIDWKINVDGRFEILKPYNTVYSDSTYEVGVGNTGTTDIIIDSPAIFYFDLSDAEYCLGTYYNETSNISIEWNDATESLDFSNYGVTWSFSGSEITLIGNTHSLEDDLVKITASFCYLDTLTGISFDDSYYVYGYAYWNEPCDIYFTDDTEISGAWSVVTTLGGFIRAREIPDKNVIIGCDFRGTKFRRYAQSSSYGAWNSGTAYVLNDIITYSGVLYVCTQANTNKQPNSSSNYQYWHVLQNNLASYPYFLPKTKIGISLSYTNVFEEGKVTGVALNSGGSGYTAGAGNILTLRGGDTECTLSCTANGSGVITGVDSIVTTGYGYPMSTKTGDSTPASNVKTICEAGTGCTINITGTTSGSQSVIISPNTASYQDFYFIQDPNVVATCKNTQIFGILDSAFDCVFFGSNIFYDLKITVASGCFSSAVIFDVETRITGNCYIRSLNTCKIANISSVIADTITYVDSDSISSTSIYSLNRAKIGSIARSILRDIYDTNGDTWNDFLVTGTMYNTRINSSQYSGIRAGSSYFNTINEFWRCGLSGASTSRWNTITGSMQRCYISGFFEGNTAPAEVWYMCVRGDCKNNQFNALVGHETFFSNNSYPVMSGGFLTNIFNGNIYDIINYRYSISLNFFKTTVSSMIWHSKVATSLQGQFSNNICFGSVYDFNFYGNNVQITSNRFFNNFGNFTFTATSSYDKIITNCIFYGICHSNEFNGGKLEYVTALGTFGGTSMTFKNVFNKSSTSTAMMSYVTVGTDFRRNTLTTGNILRCTIGTTCDGNAITHTFTDCIIGNDFQNNTMTGDQTVVQFGSNVSGLALAAKSNQFGFGYGSYPTSAVQIGSGSASIGFPKSTVSTDRSLSDSLDFIKSQSADGKIFTLPTAVGCNGRVYITPYNNGLGTLILTTQAGQNISGKKSILIPAYGCVAVVSNGTEWELIGTNGLLPNQMVFELDEIVSKDDEVVYI